MRLVNAVQFEHHGTFTRQAVVEAFLMYDRHDFHSEALAKEALVLEQKLAQLWERAAHIQDIQGEQLQWMMDHELHHKFNAARHAYADGTQENPIDVDD
jgi:hypothetical protein